MFQSALCSLYTAVVVFEYPYHNVYLFRSLHRYNTGLF